MEISSTGADDNPELLRMFPGDSDELAYVARVTTMGELAAGIAHEVNQPLGAIANNASVARRLAAAESAGALADLRDVLSDIVSESNRASSIIACLRGLVKRVAPSKEPLESRAP